MPDVHVVDRHIASLCQRSCQDVDLWRDNERVPLRSAIPGLRPPLAGFLSHVHSDHLVGLESLKSPFVYCSAATKELLLRLERYPHRLNFANGVLESRKQQYKHLKTLLKPIPLETPTLIELEPGNEIQVTLFDANHCTGAVMFLFEASGKAVLYTGDIRSEPWFVNTLCRNPFLVEYTSGLKTLDCVYLDTSNIVPIEFPTKADGLKELLQKVSAYPADTTFHFAAWTFGYEEVWMALSRALRSPIHVDKYKLRLYQSLRGEQVDKGNITVSYLAHEGPVLAGYTCGNTPQAGCLTSDQSVRIHSCEKGTHCAAINEKTVWIRPIIARTEDGSEIAEIGVGGGGGDLAQRPELQLESDIVINQFLALFATTDDATLRQVKQLLSVGIRSNGQAISLDDMGFDREEDELSLADLTKTLVKRVTDRMRETRAQKDNETTPSKEPPKIITFPYSRHSSYAELCQLVGAFKPKEVYPCTVDEQNWHEGISIQTLFGSECSGTTFRHDQAMRQMLRILNIQKPPSQQTPVTTSSQSSQMLPPRTPAKKTPSTSEVGVVDMTGTSNESSLEKASSVLSDHRPPGTPPHDRSTTSPGSASQSLRRKAIEESLDEVATKRLCLGLDGASFSAIGAGGGRFLGSGGDDLAQLSRLTDAPPAETSMSRSQGGDDTNRNSISRDQGRIEKEHDSEALEEEENEAEEDEEGIVPDSFFDRKDQVLRCNFCGHEIWRDSMGFCTGCELGLSEFPYFEILNSAKGSRHGIALDEYSDEIENDHRREVVGDYMDDHSSAYDSQDVDSHLNEEYEINSFIDENEDVIDQDEDDSSSDGETDYKEQYSKLQVAHSLLLNSYRAMSEEFREIRHEVLEEFSSDDMGEMDVDRMFMVDVTAPDPVLTEVVLSQGDESQMSAVILEVEPEEGTVGSSQITSSEEGLDWKGMTSTTNNHTFEEVEL